MPNEISTRTADQIAHYQGGRDPFESLANDVAPRGVVGRPLKFIKGDFVLSGSDEDDVPLGSTMVAIMPLLVHGWVRWWDSKPTDRVFARVSLGERAPDRFSLGDNDPNLWQDHARDPWSNTMMLPMLWPADDLAATFSTSSFGGRKALGELARNYAKARRAQQPDALPLIELGSRTRQSADYGPIKEPVFTIVGFESREKHKVALDAAGILELLGEEPLPPPSAAAPKTGATFAPNARDRQSASDDMDDAIPF